MAVTKVQMFQTDDGTVFPQESEAIMHDNKEYLRKEIKANLEEYCHDEGDDEDNIDVTEYILSNSAFLLKILKTAASKNLIKNKKANCKGK